MKNPGQRSQRFTDTGPSSQRKQPVVEPNVEFLKAFADALRDILRDEHARVHS
ncbi:MAG: hypothetical protein ABSC94_16165 [Polyangiaceae bacterium]